MADKSPADDTLEEGTRKGFLGTTPDQTPNEAYSVAGVTGAVTTPETQEPGTDGSTKVDPNAPKASK